jgi:ParB-like nuclease domain/DNA methylase
MITATRNSDHSMVPIADIIVGPRHRQDLGELDVLAASLSEVGLLQPVVVTPNNRLVAGSRRLEAAKRLGWNTIPVHVVNLDDITKGEFAENACRKDFTPSEMVAILKALTPEVAKPVGRPRKGDQEITADCGNYRAPTTAAKVAAFCGVSPRMIEMAKAVTEAAEADPERYGPLQRRMDESGRVNRPYRELRQMQAAERRDEQASMIEGDVGIITGDFREAGASVDDDSIDLIFTDPPYTNETIDVYEHLARFAARVLRPGGLCLAYCGTYFVPRALASMQRHLDYSHLFAIRHSGRETIMRTVNVRNSWKPILGFCKPPLAPWWPAFSDLATGGSEKGDHPWQQAVGEARHFIDNLCPPRGIVCEPFAGSGTTCVAAHQLNRRYIAFEIDPQTAARARARVNEERPDKRKAI